MKHAFTCSGQDGRILRGDVFLPAAQSERPAMLLIAHGYKGFKDWGMFPYAAEQIANRSGLLVVTFNFSHNGVGPSLDRFDQPEQFAINTYGEEQTDLATLLDWVRSPAFPQWLAAQGGIFPRSNDMPLYLLGHSRGGASCLLYALEHPERIAGVLTWNGVTNMDLFSEDQKQEIRAKGQSKVINARTGEALPLSRLLLDDLEANRDKYDLIHRVRDARFPLALIQGSDDLPGFRDGSARLVANYPEAEWITIEGGGHTFNTVHPFQGTTPELEAAIEATVQWLQAR